MGAYVHCASRRLHEALIFFLPPQRSIFIEPEPGIWHKIPMNRNGSSAPPPCGGGRPTRYTPQIGARLCERVATSGKSLRIICADIGISPSTLFRWLRVHPQFRIAYQQAKDFQADFINDEILEIADDASQDTVPGPCGRLIPNPIAVRRSILRIDIRKHRSARLRSKKYRRPQVAPPCRNQRSAPPSKIDPLKLRSVVPKFPLFDPIYSEQAANDLGTSRSAVPKLAPGNCGGGGAHYHRSLRASRNGSSGVHRSASSPGFHPPRALRALRRLASGKSRRYTSSLPAALEPNHPHC